MGTYKISQLAECSGVPATTLRFYESAGLLPAKRSPSGYRLYDEEAVERLGFIGTAKRLGLPLEEIAELLTVWESGACRQVKADLRPRLSARLADAEQHGAELAAFVTTLRRAVDHLDTLPDRDGRCDPECDFLRLTGPRSETTATSGGADAGSGDGQERWRTVPVTCALTGDGIGERTEQWQLALVDAVRQPIPDGVQLTVPGGRAARLAELAVAEQGCCPFFDFRLHIDGERVHLQVRAPADGQQLLADLFTTS